MSHPFAERLGLQFVERASGRSRCTLAVGPEHHNPHGVAHGAVLFAKANGNYAIFKPGASVRGEAIEQSRAAGRA